MGRILWICSWYPNQTNPYVGDFVQRQAEAVSKFTGVCVLYVTEWNQKKYYYEEINATENLSELKIHIPATGKSIGQKVWKFFKFFKAYLKGYRLIIKKYGEPRLIHLNVIYPAGFFALLLNYVIGVPLITSEHWSGYFPESNKFRGVFMKALARYIARKSKAILTISSALPDAMKNHGLHGNFITIPNVVQTEKILPGKNVSTNPTFTFLHVSGFHDPSKNISGILLAVKKLSKLRKDFKIVMVGGIPLERKKYFENLATELNLVEYTEFTGPLPYAETFNFYAQANAFILFSNYEGGLPCVLAEAMSAGLPIIATRLVGVEDWVTENVGYLVEKGKIDELAVAMNKMIDNHNTFDQKKIRNLALHYFSYSSIGKKIDTIYRQYVKDKNRQMS